MSSVNVIVTIIILLAILVCYAFISQTLVQKRQQRERILANLKTRARNFKFMLHSIPNGFLPKELKLLIQRSLASILEQLAHAEPNIAAHKSDLQGLSQQITETQRQPEGGPRQNLENPQQSKEVKACLEELYKFVFHLEANRTLTRAQADSYRATIKQLVLELTADSYVLHGRLARDKEKWRLAIHYFDLALKLLTREGRSGQFDGRIAQLHEAISELQEKVVEEAPSAPAKAGPDPDVEDAWAQFGQEEPWKKKQIYD